jgi:hypothetical protein
VRFKEFPPGWGHLFVPTGSRAGAAAGIALYTPGSWRGIAAQRAAWWAARWGSPRLLPGRARPWDPPMEAGTWDTLRQELQGPVGGFDAWAGYLRRGGRSGLLLLLLRDGLPVGFVKARLGGGAVVDNEYRALEAVYAVRPTAFRALQPLGTGTCGEWSYLITAPLPPRLHRRADDAVLPAVLDDVQRALATHPKPAGTPSHWVPAHGDFAPWNVRRIRRHGTFVIDWEEAGWAPPGSDLVYYAACAAALGRPVVSVVIEPGEAAQFCWQRVRSRIDRRLQLGGTLGDLDRGLLEALAPGAH